MRSLVFIAAMLAAVPAHAMGDYVNLQVVAWNHDGSSALVVRTENSSGTVGTTQSYIVVSAGAAPHVFTFDDTQDADKATQKIDRAACLRDADRLSRELAAKRFRATVRRAACSGDRKVVVLPAATLREAAASVLTTPPASGPTTPREAAMWSAAEAVSGDLSMVRVAAKAVGAAAGPLVLVFWGENGDSSGPAHAAAVEDGRIGPDLRDAP